METKTKTVRISRAYIELINQIVINQKGKSLVKPKDIDIINKGIIELYKTIVLPELNEIDYPQIIKDDLI